MLQRFNLDSQTTTLLLCTDRTKGGFKIKVLCFLLILTIVGSVKKRTQCVKALYMLFLKIS